MPIPPKALASSPRSRQGFTLVELLTVIAIIGVLASILIVVIGNVRQKARGAQCMANLRSLHTAASLYIADWRHWPTYNFEHGTNGGIVGTHRFFIPFIKLNYLPYRTETIDGIPYQIGEAFLCPANTDNPGAAYNYISPRTWFPNYAMSTFWNGAGNRGINANVVTNSKTILFIDTMTNPMGGGAIYVPSNAAWTSASAVIPRTLHGSGANAVLASGAVVSVTPQTYPDLGERKYWDPEYTGP